MRAPSLGWVLIDVRRGVPLGVPEGRAAVSVPPPSPGATFSPRQLVLRGEPVFELALWCGTCPAVFDKLAEPRSTDLGLANEQLNAGLQTIDDEVLRVYADVLPASSYTVLLMEVTPHLVMPGGELDYFAHEQADTWGRDDPTTPAKDAGTPYYRTFEAPVTQDRHLHEFAVPMIPPSWNERSRVDSYSRADQQNDLPTAVAYSLLDVLQPAMDDGEDYYEHLVLSHFLLDGHHKIEAAAQAVHPIRLLALTDERASMATADDMAAMVQVRYGPQRGR